MTRFFFLGGIRGVVSCGVAMVLLTRAQAASVDPSFSTSANGAVSAITIQADGKILVGGMFTEIGGAPRSYFARLNANGTVDGSFQPANGPAQPVYGIAVSGGKIYVGAGDGLRRLDSAGTVEWKYSIAAKTFAVDSQQRVVFGGQFSRVEGANHRNVARLTSAGTLDSTFTASIGCCAGDAAFAMLPRGDGMLVGGIFQSVNGAGSVSNVALLDTAGSVAPSFSGAADPAVLALVAGPNGTLYRVSERTVVRHLSSGAIDPSFTALQAGAFDRFVTAAVQADGKVVVGGNFNFGTDAPAHIARLNPDGSLDDFNVVPDGGVNAIAVQADGSILIGGWFNSVNGVAQSGIARIVDTGSAEPVGPSLRIAAGSSSVTLSWEGSPGTHVLQYAELNTATWVAVAGTPVAANGVNSVTDTCLSAGRLYRLVRN